MRFRLSRREFLGTSIGAASSLAFTAPLAAEPATAAPPSGWRHGLSSFGDLKYPADFRHFDYVRPDAPKGGLFSTYPVATLGNQNFNTFNTMNAFVLRGDGPAGIEITFATLMLRALDEPDSLYGYAANGVEIAEDGLLYRFRLRPEARFHDGSRLTADDVAFSITILKEKGHPLFAQAIRDVAEAKAESADVVAVRFKPGRSRDLPLFVAALPIFSRAYWAGRDFEGTTLEPPLGSGAYKVGRFEQGRYIEYERVTPFWGETLPVLVGHNNFDRLRYEFFRDRTVAFEGFKARTYLYREEFTSRVWATGYDFPAVAAGQVKRETLPDDTPSGAQGWFINCRRQKFADPRTREALALAFDFEWVNANLMFGAYQRTKSYFENSDLMAKGKPGPEELALLEPWRGKVPDEVFGEPWTPPVSDGSGQDRRLLRAAAELLRSAGWRLEGGRLMDRAGQPLVIEFLDFEPGLEPHTNAFIKNLRLLGIQSSIRRVDAAQYNNRLNEFDFDITSRRFSMSPTPDEGLRLFFSSETANVPGSSNLSGIRDPAIDAVIKAALESKTRAELTTACRALDRLVRAGRYWVPAWFKGAHTVAYWDVFRRPGDPPRYGFAPGAHWWFDADRAAAIGVPV